MADITTILTPETMRQCGLRLDAGVSDDVLQNAIWSAEMTEVLPAIGGNTYTELAGLMDADHELFIKGEMGCPPMALALAKIAYGYLLVADINATTFGSVQKKADNSQNIDPFKHAQRNVADGIKMLRYYMTFHDVNYKWEEQSTIFHELP